MGEPTTKQRIQQIRDTRLLIQQNRNLIVGDVKYFSRLRIMEKIKMDRESSKRRTKLLYLIQGSLFTVLVGALSFMGAFVFRDFFLALFKTSLKNAGMPRLVTDITYLFLVMIIAVPALTLVTWAKAKMELKMSKGDILEETKKDANPTNDNII